MVRHNILLCRKAFPNFLWISDIFCFNIGRSHCSKPTKRGRKRNNRGRCFHLRNNQYRQFTLSKQCKAWPSSSRSIYQHCRGLDWNSGRWPQGLTTHHFSPRPTHFFWPSYIQSGVCIGKAKVRRLYEDRFYQVFKCNVCGLYLVLQGWLLQTIYYLSRKPNTTCSGTDHLCNASLSSA